MKKSQLVNLIKEAIASKKDIKEEVNEAGNSLERQVYDAVEALATRALGVIEKYKNVAQTDQSGDMGLFHDVEIALEEVLDFLMYTQKPHVDESTLNEASKDSVAQKQFKMNYSQLGKNEKEWVDDEIDNIEYKKKKKVTEQVVNENLSPELIKKVSLFIKSIAKTYGYSEADAISGIKQALAKK